MDNGELKMKNELIRFILLLSHDPQKTKSIKRKILSVCNFDRRYLPKTNH